MLGHCSVRTDFAALALKQRFGAGDALQQPTLSCASSWAGDGQGARDSPSRKVPDSWERCPLAFKLLHRPHTPIAILSCQAPLGFIPRSCIVSWGPLAGPHHCCPHLPPHPLGPRGPRHPSAPSQGDFSPALPTASVPRVNI